MQVIKYVFQPHGDNRGQLVALEEFKDIPFRVKRVYYMYDTAKGVTRGYHAPNHYSRFWFAYMVAVRLGLIMVKKRKLSL